MRAPPPAAPRRGSSRSPCSGTGCRPAPRGSRRRSATALRASRSCVATISPGVQNPHCTAPASRNASCTGCSSSSRREPFDGHDLAPLGLPRRDQARAHQHAVEVDRARPALALLARVLGARQRHPLAQHVQQRLALPEPVDLARLAVDRARQAHRALLPRPRQRPPREHAQRVPPVRGACRARRRSATPPRRPARRSARPRPPAARRPSPARPRTPPPRARAAASAPRTRCTCPRARRDSVQRERADRDHHRVARPDLRELLRPAARTGIHTAAISSSVGEHVALRPDDELLDRHAAATPRTRLHLDLGAARVQRRQRVTRRRRRSEVPPDRPPVADLRRADRPRRHRQPRQRRRRARAITRV